MSQLPYSCVDRSGHLIFESQTFGIGLGLSVIFPSYFQTASLVQTPVLPPPPESSVKSGTPVHIGILICSGYSGSNGDTVHSSDVKYIGRNLAPKQWVSALLSISVANSLQITLS